MSRKLTDLQQRVLEVVRHSSLPWTTSIIAERTPFGVDRNLYVYLPEDIRPILRQLEKRGLVKQVARQGGYGRIPELKWSDINQT